MNLGSSYISSTAQTWLAIVLIICYTSFILQSVALPVSQPYNVQIEPENFPSVEKRLTSVKVHEQNLNFTTHTPIKSLLLAEADGEDARLDLGVAFLRNILPDIEPIIPPGGNETNVRTPETIFNILSRFMGNVIVDSNSLSHIQFYNADFEGNADNESMYSAVFGSPLCFGLCFNGQIYSKNTSVKLLSDKQFSLIGGGNRVTSTTDNGEGYEIKFNAGTEHGIHFPTDGLNSNFTSENSLKNIVVEESLAAL